MKNLADLRKEIDIVDDTLLDALAKRQYLVTEVGKYKKEHALPIIDKKREQQKLTMLVKKGEKLSLSDSLISQIWKILYNDAYTHEK